MESTTARVRARYRFPSLPEVYRYKLRSPYSALAKVMRSKGYTVEKNMFFTKDFLGYKVIISGDTKSRIYFKRIK